VALSRDSKYFRVPTKISGMVKATNVKFGRSIHSDRLNKCPQLFFSKKGRGPGHVRTSIFRVPPNISGTGKATNIKFGVHIQSDRLNKSP